MRILVVGVLFPWPQTNGGRIRVANVVNALSRHADVDYFTMYDQVADPPDLDPTVVPEGAPIARAGALPRPRPARSRARRLDWLIRGRLPVMLWNRNYDSVRAGFRSWIRHPYDVAWYQWEETYLALGGDVDAPAIVDLDVLGEDWIMQRLATSVEDHSRLSPRLWVEIGSSRKNARLFKDLHARVATDVHAMVVSAEEDLKRVELPNAVVIPNGFDPPDRSVGRTKVGDPPTVLFNGILSRHAKEGAARYFLEDIMPLVRRSIPNLSVRMVGRGGEAIRQWHDPPRVVVTGWVPDMAEELAKSDVLVAPMRYAGGTLLKVAEAFAHKIPVVATTAGARGYRVESGRHLLIGDTPEAFADACIRLLTSEDLRTKVVDEAHRLFLERYQWSGIQERIADLARTASASRVPAGPRGEHR